MSDASTHSGSCHCGAVRFEATFDLSAPINRCNCTLCTKASLSNIIVKPDAFKLLSGEDKLTNYRRGEGGNHFPFCAVCGIHVFGRGHVKEMGGDYVAINAACLDEVEHTVLGYHYWDGRHDNWQAGTQPKPWPTTR